MVTAELAFGALGVAVVVAFVAGLFAMVIAQVRCTDAAGEIARQAARGDQAAVARVEAGLPDTVRVAVSDYGEVVSVTVTWPMHPWGSHLGTWTLKATAETLNEEVLS